MRGESERKSLNRIKSYLFCHKERQFEMMMSEFYYEITDDNLIDNISRYIMIHRDCYCRMVFEDIKQVFIALQQAKENPKLSEFPDFIFDNGFIEHFKVTSSKEGRKGSTKIIEENRFKHSIADEEQQFIEYCQNNPKIGESRSVSWSRKGSQHSYQNLQNSFKKQFEHHLNSLTNYKGNSELKIFIIEYSDYGIEMEEDLFKNYPDNAKRIPTREPKHFWNYRLSKDKNMLNYLYNFQDKIDYVIYDSIDSCEIIKIDQIPQIIKSIPYDYVIVGRNNIILKKLANLILSVNLNGETNEQN